MHRFIKLMHHMLENGGEGYVSWGRARSHDMTITLQWLYEKHPMNNEPVLLDTMRLLTDGAFDWSYFFSKDVFPVDDLDSIPDLDLPYDFQHVVNVAQGQSPWPPPLPARCADAHPGSRRSSEVCRRHPPLHPQRSPAGNGAECGQLDFPVSRQSGWGRHWRRAHQRGQSKERVSSRGELSRAFEKLSGCVQSGALRRRGSDALVELPIQGHRRQDLCRQVRVGSVQRPAGHDIPRLVGSPVRVAGKPGEFELSSSPLGPTLTGLVPSRFLDRYRSRPSSMSTAEVRRSGWSLTT